MISLKERLILTLKEDFLASDYNGISVAEKISEQAGVIGERIEISAFEKLAR